MNNYIYRPAHELAELIRTGQASSYDIVKAHIEQMEKNNEKLGAMARIFKQEALELARKRDREVESKKIVGPLHGVPVTIKENFWIKGTRSTLNHKMYKNFIADEDATIVKKIRQTGAVIIGKTNLAKMIMDYQVWGDVYPEAFNPYNRECTPGGSTGGGAAAVAAGFTPLELGSDVAGSCRLPAAFCGIYGMKGTDKTHSLHGLVPALGHERGSLTNMAHAGPLARDPKDLEIFWKAIRGTDINERDVPEINWPRASQEKLADFRVGWVSSWPGYPVSFETEQKLTAFIHDLSQQRVAATKLQSNSSLHQETLDLWMGLYPYLSATEIPVFIRPFAKLELKNGLFKGWGKKQFKELDRAFKLDAKHYAEMIARRYNLIAKWEKLFMQYDLLITPVSFDAAFKRRKIGQAIEFDGQQILYPEYCFPFVACFNATGHPAISMPLGLNKAGLPIGVQIVGAYWSEAVLLRFAQLVHQSKDRFVKPKEIA